MNPVQPVQAPATAGASQSKITLQSVKAGMKIPPQFQEMYTRVVIAGMKVMFSDQSHHLMEQELKHPGTIAEKLGRGIAGLMLLLYKHSNKTMPPQIMIPVGMELMMHAVDYYRQTDKITITDQDIGEATQTMVALLMHSAGVNPKKVFDKAQALHAQTPQPLIGSQMGAPQAPAVPVAPPAMPAPAAPQPMPQGA